MTDIFYNLIRLVDEQDWHPAVNIFESDSEFWIEVELAGMEKEQIKVVFEKDALTISGVRKRCPQTQGYICCQLEMEYGSFYRVVRFDTLIESGKIEAHYDKGILDIHVPKKTRSGEDR